MKYERLTENGKLKDCCYTGGGFVNILLLKDRLAELEDKIEDGTLVELPCKVGDKIWHIGKLLSDDKLKYLIIESTIVRIVMYDKDEYGFIDEYGTKIFKPFATKEAAEARLKELRG